MSAPAHRSVQEIAREAAETILRPVEPSRSVARRLNMTIEPGDNGYHDKLKVITAIIHRAIAEAVKATGAREALESTRQFAVVGITNDTFWPQQKAAIAALDELGRTAK